MAYKRIGDLLLSMGFITSEQLDEALTIQKGTKQRLGDVLVSSGFVTEYQIIEALEVQLGIQYIDLSKTVIPANMAQLLSKNTAKKYNVVPVKVERDTIYLAMSDPLNFFAIEEVKNTTKKRVVPMVATVAAVDRAIITLYGNETAVKAMEEMKQEVPEQDVTNAQTTITLIDDDAQYAPTVRLVNSIISRAINERVSDIHLEPRENELLVRMRIDGMMRNIMTVPRELQSSVISRLKVMGGMDISERKVPQDGRANVQIKQKSVDLRISTLPTIFGEKLVIRILDKDAGLLDKHAIGITGEDLKKYDKLLESRSGVILIVGPTGSGKSSTMYTMLREINTPEVNIVTLEDPVEYQLKGINQVQINEKTGMVFASGLRAILRQDPDIIGVGEIRDGETASIAMRAAMTGHMVLSTIHTNDAISAIDRLLDIGVEPYLIAGATRGIISQRLARRVCPHCKVSYQASVDEKIALGIDPATELTVVKGTGCPDCYHTGYRGRTGVFEAMIFTPELRRAISKGADKEELRDLLKKGDFVSLADNCLKLVKDGTTSVEEAIRIIHSSDL